MLTSKSKIRPTDRLCLCFRCTTTKSSVAQWTLGIRREFSSDRILSFFQVHYAEEIIFELCVFCWMIHSWSQMCLKSAVVLRKYCTLSTWIYIRNHCALNSKCHTNYRDARCPFSDFSLSGAVPLSMKEFWIKTFS